MSTDIHTLAGAYALNALTELERAEFARHAAGCPSCQLEVAELQETATRLADVTSTAPPARLRAQVLDQITRTRQAGPGGGQGAGTGRHWRRWMVAAAAAVLIAIGAGAGGYALHDQPGRTTQLQAGQADQIAAVLAAPDSRLTRQLIGGARVTVVVSDSLDQGVALLQALPSPGAQAYQLWLINDTAAKPVGVLAAGATEGTKLFTGVRGAVDFGVSRGPAGGTATPPAALMTSFPLS
jgi:anti-sigma-K factor RskA